MCICELQLKRFEQSNLKSLELKSKYVEVQTKAHPTNIAMPTIHSN